MTAGQALQIGDYMTSRYEILGMPFDKLAPAAFVESFVASAAQGEAGYVCVPNVAQCVMVHDDPEFAGMVARADHIMSDSMVLHRFVDKKYGLPPIEVLRGDKLMLAICAEAATKGVPIALLGGKDDALLGRLQAELERLFPGLRIAFGYSPPFRALSAEEEARLITEMGASGAQVLFVGLGCPKQERWMARHSPTLKMQMIGVGAAFDWISGDQKASPDWVHAAGLEWLNRLVSEPRRLWKRYLTSSPRFLWLFYSKDRRPVKI